MLAPNAKMRAMVVPQEPQPPTQTAPPAECEAICAHHRPVRLSWARLLKRVFDLDLEHCPNCGGELKVNAAIPEAPMIEKILTHVALQVHAPPPARGQLTSRFSAWIRDQQRSATVRVQSIGRVERTTGPGRFADVR